jgi:hypothetical protein
MTTTCTRLEMDPTMSNSSHSIVFSEEEWLRSLVEGGPRPNLLVRCDGPTAAAVALRVSTFCHQPFEQRLVPGDLQLPDSQWGTLVLHDVSALTFEQQITLYDWMSQRWVGMQVISITSSPLLSHVNSGRFLEGLYYRLNVVYLVAELARREDARR